MTKILTGSLSGVSAVDGRSVRATRIDIQALRALAVLLVFANHISPHKVPGGYIGVDIFFVISGYLITSHLLRDARSAGGVRLATFWSRRAKRLLPAAITVLLATMLAASLWTPLTARQVTFDQIGAAGAYILNWLLAAEAVDYFRAGSAASPVTHYWSLSVEEQFYIFWPLLVLLAFMVARKRSERLRVAVLVGLFLAVFVMSFAWANYSSNANPASAYFETSARAWEFAAGGLLVFVPTIVRNRALLIPFAWLGWLALIGSAFVLNSRSGFPGSAALVPVLATCALIWIGDIDQRWSPTKVAGIKPIQFTGNISYSLYLWHWPLILFVPVALALPSSAVVDAGIVTVAFVLAYLSKRFIEDPVRTTRASWAMRPAVVLSMTAATIVLILGGSALASADYDRRTANAADALYEQSLNPDACFGAQSALSGEDCLESQYVMMPDSALLTPANQRNDVQNGRTCMQGRFPVVGTEPCSFGVPEGTQRLNVALIGDSHANVWSAGLDMLAVEYGLRVRIFAASGCPVTLDPTVEYIDPANMERSNLVECGAWREAVIDQLASDKDIDVVVATSRDRSYGTIQPDGHKVVDNGDGYVEAWSRLLDAGKDVVVLDDVPDPAKLIPECVARDITKPFPCSVSAEIVAGDGPLASAAGQITHPGFSFIETKPIFCDEETCRTVIGGLIAYGDSNHLSAPFVRSLASILHGVEAFSLK